MAKDLVPAIKLYFLLIEAQLKGKLQYKTSFLFECLGQFLITFLDFVVVLVLLGRFPNLKGWSLPELAFLYGLSSISFSLAQLFSRGFEVFERYIQAGELDRVLVRPVSPFLQILGIEMAIYRLGRLAQGIFVLIFGLTSLNVTWDLPRLTIMVMALVAGLLTYLALLLLGAVSTFWTVSTAELTNVFTYGGTYLSSFPMSIYQDWFRNFFTFFVPLAFISYLPAAFILGKDQSSGLPGWDGWLSLPASLIFFFLSLATWRWGLRKYQSTGS